MGQEAHEWRRQALEAAPSLLSLSLGDAAGLAPLIGVRARASALNLGPDMMAWLDRLHDLSHDCQWNARERVADIRCARAQADHLARQAAQHLEPFGEAADLLRQAAKFVVARRA